MKIGRNAPCPCGSGKKFKKCCLNKTVTPIETLDYRRLSKSLDHLMPRLIDYGQSVFGEKVVTFAMDEFLGWPEPDEAPDEGSIDRAALLFWPWFVFNWEYNRLEDENNLLNGPEDTTIAEMYLDSKRLAPQSPEGRLISAANRNPFSFLEVVSARPGQTVQVKDLLTGADTIVQETLGSEVMKAGDIVFGRVIQVDAVAIFFGLSAFVLPPRMKPHLIALRRAISDGRQKISRDDLYEWDLEIRELFWDMDRALHTPPEMRNTDGDPMEFHKLIYDIEAIALTIEKLASLCATETIEEIKSAAEKNSDGSIKRATLHWNREGSARNPGMPNTLLGGIEIHGNRMTVTVNSAQRAKTIQEEIEKRLGTAAKLRLDEISDLEAMMDAATGPAPSQNELMAHPEIRQHMEKMLQTHWDTWVDLEIPALGHKTPKQAVRTLDGREAVEALLRDAERMAENDPSRSDVENRLIADVRRRLKLDTSSKRKPARPDPKELATRIARVKKIIAAFGDQRLHDTYTDFALSLCDTMAKSDLLNINRGSIDIWAAAIVYAIAQLNFLFSPETPHHLSPDELCNWFQVKKTTVSSKASTIRKSLELFHDDERFCAPHITQVFQFVEDDNGFIFPASASDFGEDEMLKPIPLKPPAGVKKKKPKRMAKSGKQKKRDNDGQLLLFKD